MPNTEMVVFQGKAKWVRPYQPNKYNKWSIDLYLDKDQAERFKSYKTKTYMKWDDVEKMHYVTFSRPVSKLIRGKETGLAPPVVTDSKGQPLHNVPIGNYSDCTITCELYGYVVPGTKEKLKAIRLFAIRVDNLIPFEPSSYFPDELPGVESLAQVPPPDAGWGH